MADRITDSIDEGGTAGEHASINATSTQQIVEGIREDYAQAPDWIREGYRNLVFLVGERLNKERVHFFAELVQNAEDAYARRLTCLLTEHEIVLQNDGEPFKKDDVYGICRAAASSKRHREDQIGFMGVGFKSVFKVTAAPQVHSNGFHFQIQDYIMPFWIQGEQQLPDTKRGMTSAFVLPLKESVVASELAEEMERIDPIVLLFLQHLQAIEIDLAVLERTRIIEVSRTNADVVRLDDSDAASRFWQLARFPMPDEIEHLRPPSRPHEATSVQIACLVDEAGRFQRLEDSRFFAFLPTEHQTNLGFHLQADFTPTTSRETLEEDDWNKALLNYAGASLATQLGLWAAKSESDSPPHGVDLYNLVPLPSELTGDRLALAVGDALHTACQEMQVVLTRSNSWVTPAHARHIEDQYAALRELVGAEDLSRFTGMDIDFTHPEIGGRASDVLTEALAVQLFQVRDFVDMLDDPSWFEHKSLEWHADLLIFLHGARSEFKSADELSHIKSLKLIPLEGGNLDSVGANAGDHQIFLPDADARDLSYSLFSSHIRMVSQELLRAARAKGCLSKLQDALRWLGVKPLDPFQLIKNIILPFFTYSEWRQLSGEQIFQYLNFVREHWHVYVEQARTPYLSAAQIAQQVASSLKFKTRSPGNLYTTVKSMLLPNKYEPADDLEKLLEDVPGLHFVSEEYAERERQDMEQKRFSGPSWGEFFRQLGVLDRLDLKQIVEKLILPQYARANLSMEDAWALTDFVRCHLEQYKGAYSRYTTDPLATLKSELKIATTASKLEAPSAVYLSRTYVQDLDVAIAFEGLLRDKYVSDEYLTLSMASANESEREALKESWADFFETIGILLYVPLSERVQPTVWSYSNSSYVHKYPGLGTTWKRENSTQEDSVTDHWNSLLWECLRDLGTLKDPKQQVTRARALLRMLDKHWGTYEWALGATYSWFYYSSKHKWIPSEFASTLKQYAWLPTRGGTLAQPHRRTLYAPRFVSQVGNLELTCAEEVHNEKLREFLGIKSTLTPEDIIGFLVSESKSELPDQAHIKALYAWLQQNFERLQPDQQARMASRFTYESLIFAPGQDGTVWHKSSACVWSRPTSRFLAKEQPVLSQLYPEMYQLFVKYLGVSENLAYKNYPKALTKRAAKGPLEAEEYEDVFAIYMQLERETSKNPLLKIELASLYKQEPIWLCDDGVLRASGAVYVNDNQPIYDIFQSIVNCLWVPHELPSSALKHMTSAFGISKLSEVDVFFAQSTSGNSNRPSDSEEYSATNEATNVDLARWQNALGRLLGSLAMYVYTRDPEQFATLLEAGSIAKLHQSKVILERERVPVVYKLKHGEEATASQMVFVDIADHSENAQFHIAASLRFDDSFLAQELCRVLNLDREAQNFIDSILPRMLSSDSLARFISQQQLKQVPTNFAERMGLAWQVDITDNAELNIEQGEYVEDEESDELEENMAANHLSEVHQEALPKDDDASAANQVENAQPAERSFESNKVEESTQQNKVIRSPRQTWSENEGEEEPRQPTRSYNRNAESETAEHNLPNGSGREGQLAEQDRLGATEFTGTQQAEHVPAKRRNVRRIHFATYVYTVPEGFLEHGLDNGANKEAAQRIKAVDQAGIKRVVDFEGSAGRRPTVQHHNNEGFDIISCNEAGEILRYIEVKSLAGPWSRRGATLSAKQFEYALRYKHDYWLYVVERSLTEASHIYCIQDPAGMVNSFVYDDGWRALDRS